MSLIRELRTRNVLKVGVVYAVAAWILLQGAQFLTTDMAWPTWVPQVFLVLLIVGFIPTVMAAWAFEITPEGVKLEKDVDRSAEGKPRKRKKGRKLDTLIVIALALGLAVFIFKADYEAKLAEMEDMAAAEQAEAEAPREKEQLRTDIPPNSLAVLPFSTLSKDSSDVFFADGIHEDLLAQLARLGSFHVIARTSVLEYRDSARPLVEIANELGVANIMQGTVQKSGDRVRLNVQLMQAVDEGHLWAETFDRELNPDNIFDIQSEVAQAIATELTSTLTAEQVADLGEAPTRNQEAYNAYQQGRRLSRGETKADFEQAFEQFQRAVELDPVFKLAWIGLARVHMNNYWSYGGDPAEVEAARQAIDNAKAIDPDFAELNMAEGFYWYWAFLDYERALYHLDKAIAAMPGNAEAHMWHGWASRRSGLWDQGRASMEVSLKLDPRRSFNWAELGYTYLFLHHFDSARVAAMQSLAVKPDDYWGKTNLADVGLMASGDIEAALELVEGADDTVESLYFDQYMDTQLYARNFEAALRAARNMYDGLEVQRNAIALRELLAAQVLFHMGKKEEARQAANAALFRLKALGEQLGEDYRVDLAHATLSPILGEPPETVQAHVEKSMASRPDDRIQDIQFQIKYARIYAMAGQVDAAIEQLEPLLSPPSETTIHTVDLDPAFDGIRDHVDFVAMMDRHR